MTEENANRPMGLRFCFEVVHSRDEFTTVTLSSARFSIGEASLEIREETRGRPDNAASALLDRHKMRQLAYALLAIASEEEPSP